MGGVREALCEGDGGAGVRQDARGARREVALTGEPDQKGLHGDTALPYHAKVLEFIETPFFTKAVLHYLTDDEYTGLQGHMIANPEAGAVVPGSGGVRKLRWRTGGRGKRGGLRVIYYLRRKQGQIWMLTVYGKSARENIPAHLLRKMKEAIDDGKDD